MTSWVLEWVGHFSYPAVFLLLIACGFGAPLSEDVIVIVGGTVMARTHGSLVGMMATAYLGKLIGDTALFRLGRRLGPSALTHPRFQKLLTQKRVAWIQSHFERYGVLTVIMVRFLPGLRAPAYLIAGVSGFSTRKFLLADMAAAGVSAPVMTYLGYHYGLAVLERLHHASRGLLAAVVAAVLLLAAVRLLARRRARKAPPTPVPPDLGQSDPPRL